MLTRKSLTFFIGTFILSIAVVIGARPDDSIEAAAERDPTARTVRVGSVELTDATRDVRFPGVTRAVQRASLAFTVPARVLSRDVELGDYVRAGQMLARLDESEYVLAKRSAEATLAELDVRLQQARRDEARVERLANAKAATAEELEKVQAGTATLAAAREAAAARVADMSRLLDETVLRAPFDGTVTKVNVEPGEWTSPGRTVVEVSGSEGVEVRIEIPESLRTRVSRGTTVRVDLPMSASSVEGEVTSVASAAAGPGALFPVIVTIAEAETVVAGMAAEVVLPLDSTRELSVPLPAVLDSGSSQPFVFRIDDGVAARVAIRPGDVIGNRLTVVAEALSAGDAVAVVGHTALVDGDRVEVR